MSERAGAGWASGADEVDAEHAMQYKLLAEAERMIEAGDAEAARAVVQQLYDYSDAHFGSEQVLMRLHSYPGYQAHLREHGELLAALQQMLQQMATATGAADAAAVRRWLSAHIHHSDRAFLDFVRGVASSGA